MLILSRKPGESILIGDGIEVLVKKVRGDRVYLGITAPGEIRVLRNELHPRFEGEEDEIATPDQRVTFPPEVDQIGH